MPASSLVTDKHSHPEKPTALKQRDMNHSQHHPILFGVIKSRRNM
jgi:hypothetical protein